MIPPIDRSALRTALAAWSLGACVALGLALPPANAQDEASSIVNAPREPFPRRFPYSCPSGTCLRNGQVPNHEPSMLDRFYQQATESFEDAANAARGAVGLPPLERWQPREGETWVGGELGRPVRVLPRQGTIYIRPDGTEDPSPPSQPRYAGPSDPETRRRLACEQLARSIREEQELARRGVGHAPAGTAPAPSLPAECAERPAPPPNVPPLTRARPPRDSARDTQPSPASPSFDAGVDDALNAALGRARAGAAQLRQGTQGLANEADRAASASRQATESRAAQGTRSMIDTTASGVAATARPIPAAPSRAPSPASQPAAQPRTNASGPAANPSPGYMPPEPRPCLHWEAPGVCGQYYTVRR